MRSILHDLLAHPLAERLGWTLAHSLWQFAAVAILLAVVLMLLKRRAAQARYVASCAALAACVVAEPPGTAPSTAPATAPADRPRPALLGPPDPIMAEQLRQKLPEISLQGTPFADVVDFLRDVTGANIFVNWKGLEAAGIDRTAPVTLRVRDVSLDMALQLILRDLGGEAVKLAYVADQNVIMISTADDLAASAPPPRVGEYYMSGVEQPGTYSLGERSITLKQAIIAAGVNYTRDLEKHVVVIRRDPATGATSRIVHPLGSLVKSAVGDTHVELGDVIMVTDQPPATATQPGAATAPAEAPPEYYISGVPRDGVYSIDGGRRVTLLQALIVAGVNPPDARGQVVTVRRRHVEAPVLRLTVGELIEKGGAGDEPLQLGDQIILAGAPK